MKTVQWKILALCALILMTSLGAAIALAEDGAPPKPIPEPVPEIVDLADPPTPLSSGKEGLNAVIITENPDAVFGETVILTALVVSNAEGEVHYLWQIDRGDGWEDIPGATANLFSYTAGAAEFSGARFRARISDDSRTLVVEQRPATL